MSDLNDNDVYNLFRTQQPEQPNVHAGLALAANANPDYEAELHKLAVKTGVPLETARNMTDDVKRQAFMQDANPSLLQSQYPKVAQFLANPDNAAIAKDDIDSLRKVSDLWGAFTSGIERGALQDKVGPLHYRAMLGDLSPSEEAERQRLKQAMDKIGQAADGETGIGYFANQTGYTGRQLVSSLREGATGGLAGASIGAAVGSIAGGVGAVPGATIGAKVGMAAGSVVYNYKQEAGFAFDEFSDMKDANGKKLDRATAVGAAAAVGLINAGLETVGDIAMAKMIPGADKLFSMGGKSVVQNLLARPTFRQAIAQAGMKWVKASTTEGITEALQEVTSIIAGELAQKYDGVEAVSQQPAGERIWQAGRDAFVGSMGVGIPGAAYHGYRGVRDVQKMQQNQDFMTALGETASESKLAQRLPEKWREFVASAKEGGPVDNVYIPVEQFNQYFQSAGVNPADVALEIGAKNYSEANAIGADIVIPLEDYATHIAPTEHHAHLMQDVRLHQGDMTPREYAKFQEDRDQRMKDLAAEFDAAHGEDAPKADSYNTIKEDLLGQLLGRFDRKTAESYATLYAKGITTVAERSGVDPLALHEKYGLSVKSPLPDILTKAASTDINIDPLLDRLRAGDIPSLADVHGESLTEFVRRMGGLKDEGGDVKAMDADKGKRPFQRNMIQPETGLSYDYMREAAAEAGFFSHDVSEADFLRMLDDEIQGLQSTYAERNKDQQLLGLREMLEQIDRALQELGIDINNVTNEQVRAALDAAAQMVSDVAGEYNQSDDHADKRGYIQFGNDRKFSITLLEKADLSTFLHETGHFWLEVMGDLAEASDVSPQIEQDYETLLKWFGVENRSQIKTEHHEQFARGFEAYLMEGKAPSPELRQVFQRFKAYVVLVYRQLLNLAKGLSTEQAQDAITKQYIGFKLNDNVRNVFDRILASDAEIEASKQDGSLSSIFSTAADAGMTETEFASYKKTVEAASEAAKEDLEQKLMREYRRAQQQWYKDQRAKVQDEVADEIAQQPVYLAFDALVAGQLADGSMPGLKLNKDELVERYGAEFVKRLPRGFQRVYTTEGGVSVEVAAEIFDFASPDEMIAALVDMKPRKELIKAETEARMRDRYGDMLTDGSIHDDAVAAIHNDKRADVLAAELRALRRKQREVAPIVNAMKRDDAQQRNAAIDSIPPVSAIRDMAAGMIGQKQVRDLQPNTYLLAERKASRQAFEAAAKGDYQAAAVAKQRELLNHYLYREAVKAQEDVDSVVAYAKQLGKTPAQQRIGKAGADYLKQINDLLEQYEFKPVSGSQLDRRRNLLAWYNAQVAAGFNPAITPELLENAGQRNYKEVPVDELRALKDALSSIEALARLKNKLLGKNAAVEFTTAVEDLIAAAEKNVAGGNAPSAFKSQRGAFTVAGDWASKVGAELLQIEAAIDVLDGGRADGPWHQYIFNRASEAQTAFIETMADIGAKVNALVEEHAKSGKMDDRFSTPLSGKPITRYELISIALNVGNQQNYDKMLRGMGWTASNVDAALSRLSAADWEFVQKTWDTINELWPQIAALEKRISGVEPEKIEARAYQIRDEAGNVVHEVKGGYYPLAYDPAHSNAGLKQESGPLAGLTEAGYAPATSPRGHTKARTEGFAAPLLLDFGQVLQKHLSGVVKDLTHREFLIDANRLFNDQRVRAVLQDTLGPEYEKQFMPWLKGIANDGNGENVGPLGKMFEHARASTTTVALGFKVATIVSQAAGIFNSMEYVGSGWIAKGLRQAMSSGPLYAFRGEALEKVLSKSGEMRHRFETLDRDVRDRLRDINSGKVSKGTKAIQRAAFAGIGYADRMVAIPTWLGAYEKALSQGMDEETAIHAADGAVRRSQGAGAPKDLSQIQRRGGAMKLFTMFMTPFGAAFGRLYNAKKGLDTHGMKYAPEAIMRVLMVTAIPAVIADLLAARGPDQCELGDVACYGKWAALKSVFSVTTTVPVLREMGNFAENYLSGSTNSRDIKLSPILDTFNKVEKSAQHTLESVFGDRPFEEKDFFDLMENSGYIANLPTAQARITIEYLYDLLSGNRNPQGPGELLHDLAFRRKENK